MSYHNASDVLPRDLLDQIQEHVDGVAIYIPTKQGARKAWGEGTKIKEELRKRNEKILQEFQAGRSFGELATKFYLSTKSIERIIYGMKKNGV